MPQDLHIEILANGERENTQSPSASPVLVPTHCDIAQTQYIAVANTSSNSNKCCTLTPGNKHTQHNLVAVVTKRVCAHINGTQFAATSKHVEKDVVNSRLSKVVSDLSLIEELSLEGIFGYRESIFSHH